jgi:hypothetical protein
MVLTEHIQVIYFRKGGKDEKAVSRAKCGVDYEDPVRRKKAYFETRYFGKKADVEFCPKGRNGIHRQERGLRWVLW